MGILFYLVYYIVSSTYINYPTTSIKNKNNNKNLNISVQKTETTELSNNSNNFIKSNTLIKKKNDDFVDKMINKYAYFLNEKQKKIVKNNIHSKKFFDIIDEIFLGKEIIEKNEKISTFFLVGKGFMTTYLNTTPNCLRILNKSHKKYELGYIYTEFWSNKISEIDQLKIICSGILFHDICSNKKLELCKNDLLLLRELKKKYNVNDIIDEIYYIIYKNKNKLLRLRSILENNKSIIYSI